MSTVDKRLERLVSITEYNVQQISDLRTTTELHTNQLAENARQVSDLRSSVASLVQVSVQHQQLTDLHRQNFDAIMTHLQQMGDEIRGLQTENRRILDQLINRDENL